MYAKILSLKNQDGVTAVELLAGAVILAIVAAGAAAGWKAIAQAAPAAGRAAEGAAAITALQRVVEEAGNGVVFTEATPTAFTLIASTSSSAVAWSHRDPATRREGVLRRYAVRYYFQDGTLYRAVGAPPRWARLPGPVESMPVTGVLEPPPTPPSVPHAGQEPQPSYIFQGYWLRASGRDGIAVRSLWSETQMYCTEDTCYTVTVYRASGPEYITWADWDRIRNNPLRDPAGNVIGYLIGSDVFATPQAFQNILNRPTGYYGYYYVTGPQGSTREYRCYDGGGYDTGYYCTYVYTSLITYQEYQSSLSSPMSVADPAWQQQYADWQERYRQWSEYYRQYGMWSREQVVSAEIVNGLQYLASQAGRLPADYAVPEDSPAVDMTTARPVARYDALTFRYLDENRQPTTDPARVRTVIVTARVGSRNASASATIGIPGASASASRSVRIPTPCAANPALCPPPPPAGSPEGPDYAVAVDNSPGDRTYAVEYRSSSGEVVRGSVTYTGNGVKVELGQEAFDRALSAARAGTPGYGYASANMNSAFRDSHGWFNDPNVGYVSGGVAFDSSSSSYSDPGLGISDADRPGWDGGRW